MKKSSARTTTSYKLGVAATLVGVVGAGLVFNRFYAIQIVKKDSTKATPSEQIGGSVSGDSDLAAAASYLKFKQVRADFTPSGVPNIYGAELGISFDEVQKAIDKVLIFGPTYGEEGEKIVLTGSDLERYIEIGSQIACEYCCSAETLVQEDGEAACGCAHSIMMRGLTAYLIKNHPQVSNEEILEELRQWKKTFFPKQTLSAKLQALEEAGEPGVKELLEEFPDFLPQMVGGC